MPVSAAPRRLPPGPNVPLTELLGLLLLVALPLLVVGWIGDEVLERERFAFESPLMLWIHAHTTPGLLHLSVALHRVGGPAVMGPVFVLLTAALWLLRRPAGHFALWALGGAGVLNEAMKLAFHRPRPELWARTVQEHGASFPSGHSMFAAALCTLLVLLLWRTHWRWPVLMLGVGYALLLAFSRLVLGVHYPTDVLGGLLSGMAWVYGVWVRLGGPAGRLDQPAPPVAQPPGEQAPTYAVAHDHSA